MKLSLINFNHHHHYYYYHTNLVDSGMNNNYFDNDFSIRFIIIIIIINVAMEEKLFGNELKIFEIWEIFLLCLQCVCGMYWLLGAFLSLLKIISVNVMNGMKETLWMWFDYWILIKINIHKWCLMISMCVCRWMSWQYIIEKNKKNYETCSTEFIYINNNKSDSFQSKTCCCCCCYGCW